MEGAHGFFCVSFALNLGCNVSFNVQTIPIQVLQKGLRKTCLDNSRLCRLLDEAHHTGSDCILIAVKYVSAFDIPDR